jgi:Tfp pilus assembly protein PilW
MKRIRQKKYSNESGFSLVELLIALIVMMLVVGVTLNGVNRVQKRNQSEAGKLDMAQQSREGLDQMVRDLHQAGYPSSTMYIPNTPTAHPEQYARGIIALTAGPQSLIQFEGDVDGVDGVEVISYVTAPVSGSNCPCVIQRTVQSRVDFINSVAATNTTTMIENVASFTVLAYDAAGNSVAIPLAVVPTPANPSPIKRLDVHLEVAQQQADVDTKKRANASFWSTIRYNN